MSACTKEAVSENAYSQRERSGFNNLFLDDKVPACAFNPGFEIEPFSFESAVTKVQLVEYEFMRNYGTYDEDDTIRDPNKFEIEANGKIAFNDFSLVKELTEADVDELKKIIQAYPYQRKSVIGSACYGPRHCVHFLDDDENLIAYLEICFKCDNFESDQEELQIHCYDQIVQLEDFVVRIMGRLYPADDQ